MQRKYEEMMEEDFIKVLDSQVDNGTFDYRHDHDHSKQFNRSSEISSY